jgi:hypothetical protein
MVIESLVDVGCGTVIRAPPSPARPNSISARLRARFFSSVLLSREGLYDMFFLFFDAVIRTIFDSVRKLVINAFGSMTECDTCFSPLSGGSSACTFLASSRQRKKSLTIPIPVGLWVGHDW